MIKKQKIGSCNSTCGGYKLQNWRTEELKIYLGKSRWTKYEISYWDPKFVVTEVWPPSQYLWLHCTFTRIVLSSVIDTTHISLSCKTHQNLQQIKIWRFQSNLNGVSPISDNRKRNNIFDFSDLVDKSHRNFWLLKEFQSSQKLQPLLADYCGKEWQNFASKQARQGIYCISQKPLPPHKLRQKSVIQRKLDS